MKKTTILLLLGFSFYSVAQTVSTITGGSPDDSMVIDSEGNFYASSFSAGKIFKYDASWNVTDFTDFPDNAVGMAINSSDEIFNCDFGTSSIRSFLPDGSVNLNISQFGFPAGIIKDYNSEDMIFTKYSGNSIHRLAPDGTVTLISDAPGLNTPVGLAFDDNGVLYAANYETREIHRVLSDGSLEYIASVGASSVLGYINFAQGVLWATVLGEHKIYIVNPDAVDDVIVFAGSDAGTDDGDISVATFAAPNGILFNDTEDTMYITDFNTKNIRIITGINLSVDERFQKDNVRIITPQHKNEVTLRAKIRNSDTYTIVVRQINGAIVMNEDYTLTNPDVVKTIDTEAWQNGIYFMTIRTGKNVTTKKFVVYNN